jgi:transposase
MASTGGIPFALGVHRRLAEGCDAFTLWLRGDQARTIWDNRVVTPPEPRSDDIDALQMALTAERAARQQAEARASGAEAMVAYLKRLIAKMKRERFGQSAERGRKLLDQLELQLEELEASATEDEVTAGIAEPDPTTVRGSTRKKPVRGPLPAHLPRERVVVPAPSSCPGCGGRLVKLGEDVTETLEVVPRQWKVIQTVREKFTCRSCEKITQPPAPFHVIARARAGASLLAMILYAKFGEHQPLNRQSETYARERIELDVSTLADWVGACTASLAPLIELIRRHVLAGERLHGDDTTVPVLAKDKTVIGRVWAYVRDDRPFAGPDPPAALFFYSRNRNGEHPNRHLTGYAGILQPMLMPGLAISTMPGAGPAQSPRRLAGATAGANSSCWPISANRRWLSKRCAASTRSSRSSARSMVSPPRSGSRSATNGSGRSSASSKNGCVPNAPGCRVTPTSQRRWTTCSSAGPPSPAFSTTVVSACRTMLPSALYAGSLSGAVHGCSPAAIVVASARLQCTP